jgi:hypothetical protein
VTSKDFDQKYLNAQHSTIKADGTKDDVNKVSGPVGINTMLLGDGAISLVIGT